MVFVLVTLWNATVAVLLVVGSFYLTPKIQFTSAATVFASTSTSNSPPPPFFNLAQFLRRLRLCFNRRLNYSRFVFPLYLLNYKIARKLHYIIMVAESPFLYSVGKFLFDVNAPNFSSLNIASTNNIKTKCFIITHSWNSWYFVLKCVSTQFFFFSFAADFINVPPIIQPSHSISINFCVCVCVNYVTFWAKIAELKLTYLVSIQSVEKFRFLLNVCNVSAKK